MPAESNPAAPHGLPGRGASASRIVPPWSAPIVPTARALAQYIERFHGIECAGFEEGSGNADSIVSLAAGCSILIAPARATLAVARQHIDRRIVTRFVERRACDFASFDDWVCAALTNYATALEFARYEAERCAADPNCEPRLIERRQAAFEALLGRAGWRDAASLGLQHVAWLARVLPDCRTLVLRDGMDAATVRAACAGGRMQLAMLDDMRDEIPGSHTHLVASSQTGLYGYATERPYPRYAAADQLIATLNVRRWDSLEADRIEPDSAPGGCTEFVRPWQIDPPNHPVRGKPNHGPGRRS